MNYLKSIENVKDFFATKLEIEKRIAQILRFIPRAYTEVSDYELNGDIISVTTEDFWSDGTHDYEYCDIPISYLFMSDKDIQVDIERKQEAIRIAKEKYEQEQKLKKEKEAEEQERLEYERLKVKFEGR